MSKPSKNVIHKYLSIWWITEIIILLKTHNILFNRSIKKIEMLEYCAKIIDLQWDEIGFVTKASTV